jgi:MFS family permease
MTTTESADLARAPAGDTATIPIDRQAGQDVTPASNISGRVLRRTLSVDYLMCSFGRFALVPVLAIMLVRQSSGATWIAGVGMFCFTVSAGLSALLVSRWMPRFRYVTMMVGSMACSAVSFGLLPYTHDPLLILALLFWAGFGWSVHVVLVRVLIAESIASESGRNTIYSIQQIVGNVAAALGPFIAAALYVSGDGRPLLAFVSVTYVLAGISLVIGLPKQLRPPRRADRKSSGLAVGLRLLRDRQCRRASLLTAVGSFAYGQFYSAFALLVALAVGSALLRSVLLAGPPVAIATLQAVVTLVTNRWLRAGVPPTTILAGGVLLFGGAIFLLGLGLPVMVGSVVAMTVWAFAEMSFTPMVSVAFNRIANLSRLATSNLQGVAWTTGESLGSLCGGGIFLACYQHHAGSLYWLALFAVTILGVLPCLAVRRAPATAPATPPAVHRGKHRKKR